MPNIVQDNEGAKVNRTDVSCILSLARKQRINKLVNILCKCLIINTVRKEDGESQEGHPESCSFIKIRQSFPDEMTFETRLERSERQPCEYLENQCFLEGRESAKTSRQEYCLCDPGISMRLT